MGSGCASTRLPEEKPQTLRAVNQQLRDRWARVERTDSTLISHVEKVQVGVDSTTFYHRFDEEQRRVATDSVQRVLIRGETGSGRGSIVGIVPGGR